VAKPSISIGDKFDVITEYCDPKGPKFLGPPPRPRLPADALRSLAEGKQLVVKVWVTMDGKGRVTSMKGDWLPALVQQRTSEDLEMETCWLAHDGLRLRDGRRRPLPGPPADRHGPVSYAGFMCRTLAETRFASPL
jgi:hypothetical protein